MAEVKAEYEKYDLESERIVPANPTIVDAEPTVVIDPSDGVLTIAELQTALQEYGYSYTDA